MSADAARNENDLIYGIVGLGLMGGSFAHALSAMVSGATPHGCGTVFALDRDEDALKKAEDAQVIRRGYREDEAALMLRQCDFVFVCLYPSLCIDFLRAHRDDFKSGAIVTDISGVKSAVFKSLPEGIWDDVDFISGHPMAGGEKEGYDAASSHIFAGRNYLLLPRPDSTRAHIELFARIIKRIGFARVIETTPDVHDHKIAFTSQLCHVIACALVESAEDTKITAFGGGSFEDLTRIAMINAPLWTELFLANRAELISHIASFEKTLASMKALIANGDGESLTECLAAIREKRIAMVN
jgi:prephenate dehydrogenase